MDSSTMQEREAQAEKNFQAITEKNPALLSILDQPADMKDFIEFNKLNQSNQMSSPRNFERVDEVKRRRDEKKEADLRYRILYNFKQPLIKYIRQKKLGEMG